MRILSWNINGIRTLPQYHPWNTFKTCESILDELGADIICFQEMKSSRASLPRDVAIPPSYTSCFSFPAAKGGYSGVAVYSKSSVAVPLKAEDGLSGATQPKSPRLPLDERVSPSYPSPDDLELFHDEDGNVPGSFDALDSEGRALVLDFGLFVLINVYCPNETSDARLSFKMNFHLLLQERVRMLVEEQGRDVIVVGDINVCAAPIDHCDGHLPSNASTFWEHPARAWFHRWLAPRGPMVDVVRSFWTERKGLFTCWNMKIQARETNYGTRVDYILATQGLMKWIKHGDIQASLKGSDHCPIYIDLHDEITLDTGETVRLRDAMQQGTGSQRVPPRIAAINWEEFSGKQTLLSSFFGKRANDPSAQPEPSTSSKDEGRSPPSLSKPPASPSRKRLASRTPSAASPSGKKRAHSSSSSTASSKKKVKTDDGQATLGAFFGKAKSKSKPPVLSHASSSEVLELDEDPLDSPHEPPSTSSILTPEDIAEQLDADYRLACELSASQDVSLTLSPSASSSSSSSASTTKAAWTNLFTPREPPKCTVHDEPTRLYTVNKQGPNKGRTFYLCSRPVGPGYDKGKSERLRDEVDHQYRCNYFKWTSDLKREPSPSSKSRT